MKTLWTKIKTIISNRLKKKNPISKTMIQDFLPSAPIVIEAGAHIGTDSIDMVKSWSGAKIHAFEPLPNLYSQLVKNTRDFSSIFSYQLALGTVSGESEMHVSSGRSDASSSLLEPNEHLNIHPDVLFKETVTVNTITLDEWAAKYSIKPDFLWLDLQGFELDVLKNGIQTLQSVKAIYTEINLLENYKNAPLYDELKSWLATHGFKVQIEDLRWKDAGNALFIKTQ